MATFKRFIVLNLACILSFYTLTESCGLYLMNAQSFVVVMWIYYRSMKSDKKLPLCSLLSCLVSIVSCSIGLTYLYTRMGSSSNNIGECRQYFDNLIELWELVSSGKYTSVVKGVSASIELWIPRWDGLKIEELKYSTLAPRALTYWQTSWSTIIVTAHILITLLILVVFHTCIYNKPKSKRLTATMASPKNGGKFGHHSHITMCSSDSPRVSSPLAAIIKPKLPRPFQTHSSDDLTLQDWYHGRISDELAEDRLKCGPRGDGAYLVYDDSKVQRNYILLVRKEKRTLKWKIKCDKDSMYTLHEETNSDTGNGPPDSVTVKTVTTALHHYDKQNDKDTTTKQSADDSDLGQGSPDKTDKFKSFRKRSHSLPNIMNIKGSMKDTFTTKPIKALNDRTWYHKDITHPEAETRIRQGSIDGAYLVYDFPGEVDNYILLVLHEGKLLRWKISRCVSDSKYVLGEENRNIKQQKFENVIALIKYHRGATAQPIHAEHGKKVTLSKSYILNQPKVANDKHKEVDKGSTQEQGEDSTGGMLSDRRWYHGGDITREVAESRLEKGAGDIDGSYLVYNHPNEPGNYVLLIHYRGKILRWKITKRASDGKYMLGEESEGDDGGNTPVYDTVVSLIKSHRGVRGRPILLEDGLLVTLSKSYVIHPPDETSKPDKKDLGKVKEGDQGSLVTWLQKGASAVFQTKPLHKAGDTSQKKGVPSSKPGNALGDGCVDIVIKKYSSVVKLIEAHRGLFGEKLELSNGDAVTLVKSRGIRCPEP